MKGTKNKIRSDANNEEPATRKLTRLVPIDEGAVLAIEEEAEHDNAECSDDKEEDSEAETEIVPPSVDEEEEEENVVYGYSPESPLTADEYLDGLLKAADASRVFKDKYFPELKKQIQKVQKYKLPWYDEPACTNERFCTDDGCDTSNRYPAWAWRLLRCQVNSNSLSDGYVSVTFEPVARRVYVMFDCKRFGAPIAVEIDDATNVDHVVEGVRKKLQLIAARHGGLTDVDPADLADDDD